jgi:hypothetical protein
VPVDGSCIMWSDLNFLKPAGYGMHQQVECFNNLRSAHIVFKGFVFVWEQTATFAIYIKKTEWFL